MVDRFPVITGGATPRPDDGAEQWQCPVCEAGTGVASSETIEVTMAPRIKDGVIEGGTKSHVCGQCYLRGQLTLVT